MSDRQMCRTCFCLGYDLVPVNGEWSCMEHLNGRDAAAEIVRLNEQLAERTLQHQVQLDNAVDLTARLAAAEARVTKLTEQLALRLRAEGCDREELLKECIANREKLADAETRIVPVHVIFDGPPSHQLPRFVEVETPTGRGVRLGQWVNKGDGYWALVFNVPIDQTVGYEPATVGKNLETQQEIIDRLSRDGLDVTLPNTNEEV